MKKLNALLLTILFLSSVVGFGSVSTFEALQSIAANAWVANGSTHIWEFPNSTVEKINRRFSTELADITSDIPDCGDFTATKEWVADFSKSEKSLTLEKILEFTGDQEAVNAIRTMIEKKEVIGLFSIRSNSQVECSKMWVEVFTKDNRLMQLYYSLGD